MTTDNSQKPIAGSHRCYSDFTSFGKSPDDAILETFHTSWHVPSMSVAPYDQAGIELWAGLRSSDNASQLRCIIGLVPKVAWYLSIESIDSQGHVDSIGRNYGIQPGELVNFTIKIDKNAENFTYLVKVSSENSLEINYSFTSTSPLNQTVLSLDLNSNDYRNLPPDEKILVETTATYKDQVVDNFGYINRFNWINEDVGVLTPSRCLSGTKTPSIEFGDFTFYLK
ncbi:hypothetical protein [Ochrobactrum teleogrylli]|uniref:Uncharacterized protein n=1 Tax=Ochrobactrum teleogrylli TaxID=2479765 RepID=A0ABD5K0Y5_9HYPH